MTPSREAITAVLYVMSTFNAHDSADARQSTVPSFDLVSLLGMSNRPIATGKKKEIAKHFRKSNWPSCRQKQPHICCHYVYECNYLAYETPLRLSLPHSCVIMFFCTCYL